MKTFHRALMQVCFLAFVGLSLHGVGLAAKEKQDKPGPHISEGNKYFLKCDSAQAIQEYEIASQLGGNLKKDAQEKLATSHYMLSEKLAYAKDYPRSISELKKALELRPQEAYWHLALALLYSKAGDHEAAGAECGAALKLAPKDPGMAQTCNEPGKVITFSGSGNPGGLAQTFVTLNKIPTDASDPVTTHIPYFTYEWEKTGYRGKVALVAIVGTDGRVSKMQVIKPMGLGLDERTLEIIGGAKFKPSLRDGTPVDASVLIEFLWGPSCSVPLGKRPPFGGPGAGFPGGGRQRP